MPELLNLLSPAVKMLSALAIMYFVSDTLTSEKYRPYINIVLGVAVILAVLSPISALLKSEWVPSFSPSAPDSSYDHNGTVNGIWQEQYIKSLKTDTENILAEHFPQYKFTVRIQAPDGNYIIYITATAELENEKYFPIRELISQKTGISKDNVNIILQNKNLGDDDNG